MAAAGTSSEDGFAMMRSAWSASIFSSIAAKPSVHVILIGSPFRSRLRYTDLSAATKSFPPLSEL